MTTTTAPILRQRLQLAMLNRQQKQKSLLQKGFTLVELMIVIVIVGILSAVALPNFLSQSNKAKATECTTKLGAILSQAGAEGLADPTNAVALATTIASTESTNSQYCTFGTPANASGTTILTVTVTGKTGSDLAGNYNANGCINWSTMKRDIEYKMSSTAATTASCS